MQVHNADWQMILFKRKRMMDIIHDEKIVEKGDVQTVQECIYCKTVLVPY